MPQRHLLLVLIVCLLLRPEARAFAQEAALESEAVLLSADEIIDDFGKNRVIARGDVELTQGRRRLLADEISYDLKLEEVTASGDVVLIEPTGHVVFADRLELDADLEDGFVERVSVLLSDGARIAARKGSRRDGAVTAFEKAVYSPCEICPTKERPPLWQIKAARVVHDQTTQTITYRNAVFEVFGLPVAYTPYFFHPDPTVERRTGFLAPAVGSDTELGLTLETPFFYDLAPNRDVTLTPLITSKEGPLLATEYRELQPLGLTTLGGSITYASAYERDPQDDEGNEFRGHLEGEGRYVLDEVTRAGFDLFVSSDNTFLERYDISDEDVLENRLFLSRFEQREFRGIEAFAFQGLREDDEQGRIPLVLPLAEARYEGDLGIAGIDWHTDTSILGLTRADGLDTYRLSSEVGLSLPAVGPLGTLWNFSSSLRGDGYLTNGEPESRAASGDVDTTARLVPTAGVEVRWPLFNAVGRWQNIVEPIVSATWVGNNANLEDIPNEDSLVFEFDETNLFETSRFTGIDRVESGRKITYGLAFNSVGPRALRISGLIGQSFRFGPDRIFEPGTGLSERRSDYVGRVDLRPGPLLDLRYRFRVSREELAFRRSDLSAIFGPQRLRFDVQYISLSEDLPDQGLTSREEILAGVRLQLLDDLAVGFQTRRDLSEDTTVSNAFGLVYTNPCLVIVAGLEQSNTSVGELEDEVRFGVRIGLRGLGGLETDSDFLIRE